MENFGNFIIILWACSAVFFLAGYVAGSCRESARRDKKENAIHEFYESIGRGDDHNI